MVTVRVSQYEAGMTLMHRKIYHAVRDAGGFGAYLGAYLGGSWPPFKMAAYIIVDIYIIDRIVVLFVIDYTISLPTSPQPNEGEGAQLAPFDILNRMTGKRIRN